MGTAAITSQWAKLQYTSELFIQKDLQQSHIHCVICNLRGILSFPYQQMSAHTTASAVDESSTCILQHSSSSICLPHLSMIFLFCHSEQQHEMLNYYLAFPFMSLSFILLFLMLLLGKVKKTFNGSEFLLLACTKKGYFHIKATHVNGCIKLKNFQQGKSSDITYESLTVPLKTQRNP